MTWSIAYNSNTSLYEIHATGCKHLIHPKFDYSFESDATTAAAAKSTIESGNEGCIAKFGPCAK